MERVKVAKSGNEEIVEIYLDENQHPTAFKTKLKELIESGMTEKEAREFIRTTPFVMELYYAPFQGLFAIESEALESITAYNPYDGDRMEYPHENN